MKSRALRALLVLVALAAQAGAGYKIWQLEQQASRERSDAVDFERRARLAVLNVTELRGLQQAYVADGQVTESWQTRATDLGQAISPRLTELRLGAKSPEAQAAIETAIEIFSSFAQTDAKARDYIKSNQRLSASDVIFADGASQLARVVNALDAARGQDSVAREISVAALQQMELYVVGAAAGVTVFVLLLLLPVPRATGVPHAADEAESLPVAGGLGLSQIAPAPKRGEQAISKPHAKTEAPTLVNESVASPELTRAASPAAGPDLAAVADICSDLARVEDPRDLHGLLERTAKALDATGLIIWMPEGAQGALRPVLAYGYAPLSLTRMGAIDPAADNATAVAFRTKTVQMVSAEPLSSGAVVAPLVTSDGCSGTIALELKQGVQTTPQLKALVTVVAAQLATLITPSGSVTTVTAANPDPAAPSKA
ncbi:MAG: hypothetical protein NTY02_03895 [Acidobacteria bacterium]|nr:hypothetical protein [Acidobacteriota bacterium]